MTQSTNHSAPHQFGDLLGATRRSDVVIGAGFSAGYVPFPNQLLEEIQDLAETALGVGKVSDHSGNLYIWAEKILALIVASGESHPKLKLAEAMGLLSHRRWMVDVELNGTCPRHRVMARFAREDLFGALWSLNWDCMYEGALESIGFVRGGPVREQPWLTSYASIVTERDFRRLTERNVLCLRKPHGCVNSLIEARGELLSGNSARAKEISDRFLLTDKELKEPRTDTLDIRFFRHMIAELQSNPLIVLGWSVSEPYLQGAIKDLGRGPGTLQDLSIIDLSMNAAGHTSIAEAFQLDKDAVFFEVTRIGDGFDIDNFMLWLQARYCVTQLLLAANSEADTALGAALQAFLDKLTYWSSPGFATSWADDFIPSWTRLCWRAGVIDCPGFRPDKLRMDMPHEHIPWRLPEGTRRHDLYAAAKLLHALDKTPDKWDVSSLPGFLFDSTLNRAVIVLPAWDTPDYLASFKSLVDQVHGKLQIVEQISFIPLHPTIPVAELPSNVISDARDAILREWPLAGMLRDGNIPLAGDIAV